MENEFHIITPIPDENTCEALVYGSEYGFAKSSKFFWDRLEDMTRDEVEFLKGRIIDPEFCAHVLNSPGQRSMIFRKSPPVSHPDQIKDLWTLRRISYLGSSLEHIEVMRKQNLMWATMKGIQENVDRMRESGISEKQWKVAMDGIDMPIEYATVRSILDREEHFAGKDAEEIKQSIEERRLECEQFERDLENYRRLNREMDEDDEELLDIPIFKEVEDDSDEPDECTEPLVPEITKSPLHMALIEEAKRWSVDDIDRAIVLFKMIFEGIENV